MTLPVVTCSPSYLTSRETTVTTGRDKSANTWPADFFSTGPKNLPVRVHGPSGVALASRRGRSRSGRSIGVHRSPAFEAREKFLQRLGEPGEDTPLGSDLFRVARRCEDRRSHEENEYEDGEHTRPDFTSHRESPGEAALAPLPPREGGAAPTVTVWLIPASWTSAERQRIHRSAGSVVQPFRGMSAATRLDTLPEYGKVVP